MAVEQDTANNALVKMRWCIDPSTLQELKKKEAKNPHLLIVVWNKERGKETRDLVPLDRMMHYLPLRFPGENAILATIVWIDNGKYANLWDGVFQGHSYGYEWMLVIRQEGSFREPLGDYYHGPRTLRTLGRAEVTVMVEKEFFAKEPPAWLKDWVNFWFEGQPRDECHFRKRAIVAFTIQPLVLIPHYLIKATISLVVALFFASLTVRKISFWPIIMPWQYDPRDVCEDCRDEEPVFFQPLLWQLLPLLLLVEAGIISFFYTLPQKGFVAIPIAVLLKWLGIVVAAEYGVTLLVFLFIVLGKALDPLVEKLARRLTKQVAPKKHRVREPVQVRQQRWASELEARLTPLVCNGDLTPSLAALPKERQSLTLKFLDLKARVCKPFAG